MKTNDKEFIEIRNQMIKSSLKYENMIKSCLMVSENIQITASF